MSGFSNSVLGGAEVLERIAIRSPNYVAGVSGWAIFRDGSSEFNNGTFRGDVVIGTAPDQVKITSTLPAALAAHYVALGVVTLSIVMTPDGVGYHYQVIGKTGAPTNRYGYYSGWVDAAGNVLQTTAEIVVQAGPVGVLNSITTGELSSDTAAWTYTWGNTTAGRATPDAWQIANANIVLGSGTTLDAGSLKVKIPSQFTKTVEFDQAVTFLAAATITAAGAAAFNGVGNTAHDLTIGTTLAVTGATALNGAGNTAADLSVTADHASFGGVPAGLIDGVNVNTSGSLTAAISAETNVPNLELFGNFIAGADYWIEAGITLSSTVVTDTWEIRCRLTTAVTGTEIGEGDGPCSGTVVAFIRFKYTPAANGTNIPVFFSILRRSGTGTMQAFGAPSSGISRTYAKIVREFGPAWRTT